MALAHQEIKLRSLNMQVLMHYLCTLALFTFIKDNAIYSIEDQGNGSHGFLPMVSHFGANR